MDSKPGKIVTNQRDPSLISVGLFIIVAEINNA